jgi:MFS transporter, FSR family, fosmidomycin resistance protein
LIVVIATSSTIGIAIINFAPKLFADQGYSPVYVGATAGLYMMGSAVGGITGGTLADRINRRLPILLGMVGCILPIYFFIPAGDPWRFGLLVATGFFAGMPHSVLVILVQTLLPGRRAFASGLTLGLMFFSGAIGTYILGVVADEFGLATALQALIVLPLITIVGTLLMPRAVLGRS